MDEVQQQVEGDVVEHDAGEDFIGVEMRAQPGGHARPGSAGEGAGQQHHDQRPTTLHLDDIYRHGTARQCAEQQLAFRTDVPDARLIGDRQTQRAEQNRQGLDHQFRQAVPVADRRDQQGVQCHHRVQAQADEQQRTADQGQHRSQ